MEIVVVAKDDSKFEVWGYAARQKIEEKVKVLLGKN